MREREKQAEEFLKKIPVPSYRELYPYSQGTSNERDLGHQTTSPKTFIKTTYEGRKGHHSKRKRGV